MTGIHSYLLPELYSPLDSKFQSDLISISEIEYLFPPTFYLYLTLLVLCNTGYLLTCSFEDSIINFFLKLQILTLGYYNFIAA